MKSNLVELPREIFKDEVRELGAKLRIPGRRHDRRLG